MYVLLGIIAAAIIVPIVLFKATWRVAEPNEALIISGLNDKGEATDTAGDHMGFRIVTGKGTLVMPGVQKVRRLSLQLHQADLYVECPTEQGIPVQVKGTVIYKIGDDSASITNAARRFLDQQDQMDARVHNVFAGHLRSIVGSMTVEAMIREREQLTAKTRASSGEEMAKLGLIVDSLQIQEIDDPSGYIKNLAMPHTAAVQSLARIAQASADREATEREQEANALKAEAERNASIKEAGFQAEVDKANAESAQAGPLAQASARQAVVEQETSAARLEAARQEQILVATVIRPAEAKRDADIASAEATSRVAVLQAEGQAQKVELEARAEAAAIEIKGKAEAAAIEARGKAEGAAIQARAEALAANSEAVIMQELAKQWPEIVAAAAGAFEHVDNFTVLNGAEGVNAALMQVVGTALNSFNFAKSMFAQNSAPAAAPATITSVEPTAPATPEQPADTDSSTDNADDNV